MRNKIRVLIVEPSEIITSGLSLIIRESEHFEALAPLNETEQIKYRLVSAKPDVLIINPTLFPDYDNNNLRNIKKEYPETAIIAIVYQYVEPSILRQYQGVIDIREDKTFINKKIHEIFTAFSAEEQQDENGYELTNREIDVLVLVAKGLMNKEIAEKLNISVHTVISHRKNIIRKTNIKSVAGLAMYALMNNLIDSNVN